MIYRKSHFVFLLLFFLVYPLTVFSTENRGMKITSAGFSKTAFFGNYHSLIIGINEYKEWNPLQTAVKDAEALKEILIRRYSFKEENVILRTDKEATRDNLISDLRRIASNLTKQDNLLIYFAGHGQLDDLTGDGYWIPVEGNLKKPSTWISHATIKNILSSERVRGKNIVVVADSCYSGMLLRGGPSLLSMTELGYREQLLKLASQRSRQVITSGGLEPVADGGRDGHSLFAYYFLKALEENDRDIIDLENLFHTRVWKPVTEIGGQRPNVGRLKSPMDEEGQFVLVFQGIMQLSKAEDIEGQSRKLSPSSSEPKKQLQEVTSGGGLSAGEWFEKAMALSRDGKKADDNKIIEYCSRAISIDQSYLHAYIKRAYAYGALHNYIKSLEDCNQVIRIEPNYIPVYSLRGGIYRVLGRYGDSLKDYNKVIRLKPNNALNYNGRGNTYNDLGQYQKAIEDFNRAIRLRPNIYIVYWGRGEAYYKLGKFDYACSDFQKACELGNCKALERAKREGHCQD